VAVLGDSESGEFVGDRLRLRIGEVHLRGGVAELRRQVYVTGPRNVPVQPARVTAVAAIVSVNLSRVQHEARVEHNRGRVTGELRSQIGHADKG
jgi:hypothetical protein